MTDHRDRGLIVEYSTVNQYIEVCTYSYKYELFMHSHFMVLITMQHDAHDDDTDRVLVVNLE